MKSYQVILLVLLSFMTFSCVDNLADYGSAVQPTQDQITIGADTFQLNTQDSLIESINSSPDSFLLGSFYNSKYGSTRADIFAQVKSPLDFTFHEGVEKADSALLVLYFKSWYGDANSPLEVNVYEMNKQTFNYTEFYPTNLNPIDYCNPFVFLGKKTFTVKERVQTRPDSVSVQIKLSDDYAQRLFDSKQYFSKNADFLNYIKGLFITTKFGASTVLNISQMDVELYYHYNYIDPATNESKKVSTMFSFPANQEVRQVNRFFHDDRDVVVKHADSVNYVASPANIYTKINIPLKRIQTKMDKALLASGKMQLVNKAILKVNAVDVADSSLAMPVVNYMLLIKESALQSFFNNKTLPSDTSTVSVLGQFASTKNTTTGLYEYYYYYDIAKIVANELRVAKMNKTTLAENMKMVLVPVSVATSSASSTTVTSCKQQYKISGISIRSGKVIYDKLTNKSVGSEPMHLKLIYSGF